jgi:carboxypeptidase C (cathepsin A)
MISLNVFSSFYGAFCELGPYRPTPNTTLLTDNPFTWNRNANLLVIDQPIGVGWSYGPRQVGNQDQVAGSCSAC